MVIYKHALIFYLITFKLVVKLAGQKVTDRLQSCDLII